MRFSGFISICIFALFSIQAIAAVPNAASQQVHFRAPWTSPFQVDPVYPHQLVNKSSEHLFILNKTAWAFFACNDPDGFLARAKAQGVTVIRVALEGTPYFDHLGFDMWPWGGDRENPDWSSFNEEYLNEVERRIQLAGRSGIGIDLVLYFDLKPTWKELDQQKPYLKMVLHRLGKYTNILTWELQNEYIKNHRFQDWAGMYLKENDLMKRPVCTSAGTTDDAIWAHKRWMDLAIIHTCTSSERDLREWYLATARNTRAHGKPAFNNESGREDRHGNDDPVHRRKQGWLWYTAGGFWTYHSWEGCEGIDDADYRGPGSEYLKPMSDFFQSIPFWKMNPNFTACTVRDPKLISATLAENGRGNVLCYICTAESGKNVKKSELELRLPGGQYIIYFYRPANGELIESRNYSSKGLDNLNTVKLPKWQDDIAVLITKLASYQQSILKRVK